MQFTLLFESDYMFKSIVRMFLFVLVSFKIPNEEIDRSEGMFVTNWDADEKRFTLTLYFVDAVEGKSSN